MTKNQIEYWKNVETERHNKELEAQGLEQIRLQKEYNQAQVRLQTAAQAETARSNLAREQETNRSNLATEGVNLLRHEETVRSNQAYEQIGRTNAGANVTSAAAAYKQAGAAVTNATTNQKGQSETVRHNRTTENTAKDQNPWTSIATSMRAIIPYVADKVTTIVTNLKSNVAYSYNQPRNVVKPVSQYNR